MISMKSVRQFFSLILIVNLYLDLTVFGVDSLLLVLFIPCLLFSKDIDKTLFSLLLLCFLYVLTCFYSGSAGQVKSDVLSFMQFVVALLVFFSLNRWLNYFTPAGINSLVFKVLILVTIISLIQFSGVDGGAIEYLRSLIHPQVYDLSVEASRDEILSLAGTTRPLGLAKEPSYLSIFVIFCGYVILTLGNKIQKIIYAMVYLFFFYANTSPFLGLLPIIIGVHSYLNVGSLKGRIYYFIGLFFAVLLCLILLRWRFEIATNHDLSWNFLFDAYKAGLVTTESSLGIRIYNPFITMYNVLSDNFLFGAGFSNLDYISNHSNVLVFSPRNVLSNALASGFIYSGCIGMLIVFFVVRFQTKIQIRILIPFSIILSFTGGGFFTIRFWSIMFLFIAVFQLCRRGKSNAVL